MRRNLASACIVGAGLLLGASEAVAQGWLADRAAPEGNGIRVGNFELHPGIGAEVGVDSNTFFGLPQVSPAVRLRISPTFNIRTLGQQRSATPGATSNPTNATPPPVNFSASVGLLAHFFFPFAGVNVNDLFNLGVYANINVHILPSRPWQFRISDTLTRSVTGAFDGSSTLLAPTFNTITNTANLELIHAPNSGTLEFKFGYNNRLTFFENVAFSNFSGMGNDIYFRNQFKLWYRTSLVFGASASPSFFFAPTSGSTGVSFGIPITGYLGFNGLITDKLSLTATGGIASSSYFQGDNVTTFIGQIGVRYVFSDTTGFSGGFNRDLQPSYIGNYSIRNRFNLAINQMIAGRFYINLDAGFAILQNGYVADVNGLRSTLVTTSDPTGRFVSFRFDAKAYLEYRFNNYFGVNLTGTFATNQTDAQAQTIMGGMLFFQTLSWTKAEVFLGARANW